MAPRRIPVEHRKSASSSSSPSLSPPNSRLVNHAMFPGQNRQQNQKKEFELKKPGMAKIRGREDTQTQTQPPAAAPSYSNGRYHHQQPSLSTSSPSPTSDHGYFSHWDQNAILSSSDKPSLATNAKTAHTSPANPKNASTPTIHKSPKTNLHTPALGTGAHYQSSFKSGGSMSVYDVITIRSNDDKTSPILQHSPGGNSTMTPTLTPPLTPTLTRSTSHLTSSSPDIDKNNSNFLIMTPEHSGNTPTFPQADEGSQFPPNLLDEILDLIDETSNASNSEFYKPDLELPTTIHAMAEPETPGIPFKTIPDTKTSLGTPDDVVEVYDIPPTYSFDDWIERPEMLVSLQYYHRDVEQPGTDSQSKMDSSNHHEAGQTTSNKSAFYRKAIFPPSQPKQDHHCTTELLMMKSQPSQPSSPSSPLQQQQQQHHRGHQQPQPLPRDTRPESSPCQRQMPALKAQQSGQTLKNFILPQQPRHNPYQDRQARNTLPVATQQQQQQQQYAMTSVPTNLPPTLSKQQQQHWHHHLQQQQQQQQRPFASPPQYQLPSLPLQASAQPPRQRGNPSQYFTVVAPPSPPPPHHHHMPQQPRPPKPLQQAHRQHHQSFLAPLPPQTTPVSRKRHGPGLPCDQPASKRIAV